MNNKLYIIGVIFLFLLVPNVLALETYTETFRTTNNVTILNGGMIVNTAKGYLNTTPGGDNAKAYWKLPRNVTTAENWNLTYLVYAVTPAGIDSREGIASPTYMLEMSHTESGGTGLANYTFTGNNSASTAHTTFINSGWTAQANWQTFSIIKIGNNLSMYLNGTLKNYTNNYTQTFDFDRVMFEGSTATTRSNLWTNITLTIYDAVFGFVSPTPSTNTLYQNNTQNNIAGNVSGSGLNNISVYLSRSGTLINSTFVVGNSTTFNYTNLANGIYTLNATAFNSTHQLWTENRIITIYNALLTITTNPSTSFSVNVGSENYNSTANQVQALVINGSTYNILLDATNYAYYTTNVTITNATTTLTANLMPSNSINITFKDALTLATILQPLSITVTESTATNYSTSTGQIFIQNLTTGINEFKVSNVNYTESRIYIDITNRSTQSIIMYLQQSGSILNLTLNWYDVNGAAIKNLYVTESVIGINGSVLVASYYTDIDGASYFSYNNAYYYSYDCESTIYDCVGFVLNPPRKSSYDITLGYLSSLINYSVPQVTGAISFNNITNILTFNYVSTETGTHTYEYQVIKILNSQAVSICTDSSTSTSDTFTCDLSGYYDQIYVQGTIDSNTKFFGQWININRLPKLFDNLEQKDASYYAFFLLAIIIMGAAFFGVVAVLVTTVLGIILLTMIGLTNIITVGIIITIMIISIIIILGFKRR